MAKALSLDEVAKHNAESDCWLIIDGRVYDVTEFIPLHPGGKQIILKYAGRDATAAYKPIHPEDALEKNLSDEKHLGPVDPDAVAEILRAQANREKTQDELRMERAELNKPPLKRILTLHDMEDVARGVLSYKAAAYYSSAADDQIAHTENLRAFSRLFFHPRVLRAVSKCDPSTTILGFKSLIPVFVSAAALAKLGHPLGEMNITRGAGRMGVIQMVSTNASFSPSEIAAARVYPDQPLFFQLYKHRDDSEAEKLVKEVEALGYNAIFLTVDAIVAGRRDRDIKAPFVLEDQEKEVINQKHSVEGPQEDEGDDTLGTAGALISANDADMTWERTIPWLRKVTRLPIVIKGIQCVADAVLAAEAGVDGILISNHGGRQLEYSMPSIEVLYRLRMERPDVFQKVEVYIEGGARRGTDVLKALCLGAAAVGIGRPFLYAQSAYGDAGVAKIVKILEREIVSGMQLLGASRVRDLVPEMVERISWQPELPILAKL